MAFQVGGVDLSGDITSYANIENPADVGNYETVKCKVTFCRERLSFSFSRSNFLYRETMNRF